MTDIKIQLDGKDCNLTGDNLTYAIQQLERYKSLMNKTDIANVQAIDHALAKLEAKSHEEIKSKSEEKAKAEEKRIFTMKYDALVSLPKVHNESDKIVILASILGISTKDCNKGTIRKIAEFIANPKGVVLDTRVWLVTKLIALWYKDVSRTTETGPVPVSIVDLLELLPKLPWFRLEILAHIMGYTVGSSGGNEYYANYICENIFSQSEDKLHMLVNLAKTWCKETRDVPTMTGLAKKCFDIITYVSDLENNGSELPVLSGCLGIEMFANFETAKREVYKKMFNTSDTDGFNLAHALVTKWAKK